MLQNFTIDTFIW